MDAPASTMSRNSGKRKPGPKPGSKGHPSEKKGKKVGPSPLRGIPKPKYRTGPDGEQIMIQYGAPKGVKRGKKPEGYVSPCKGRTLPRYKTGPDGEQIKIKYGRPRKEAGSGSGPADDGKPQ